MTKTRKKLLDQVAGKTVSLATKIKDSKIFEHKYKTLDGKILTYTPHTAWVQPIGNEPRLLRNSGTAFVPSPLIYGPCRPSRLSDYYAYKSARRTGHCLRFLDIENPISPQHPMLRQDEQTELPIKLTKQKKAAQNNQGSSTKRKPRQRGKEQRGD